MRIARRTIKGLMRSSGVALILAFLGGLGFQALSLPHGAKAIDGVPREALPRIYTNEEYINDLIRPPAFDISDVRRVFQIVLEGLPEKVNVYPTENYYYFYFYHDGVKYAGNIRLDVDMRDRGEVIFVYFKASTDWKDDDDTFQAIFTSADGIKVDKLDELSYRVTSKGKSVVFQLNDLTDVAPPPGTLAASEKYLGPVFDESGIRFFLVFNEETRKFLFVLDDTAGVADKFITSTVSDSIVIGRRTGFAFYRDPELKRRVLVAVYGPNTSVNNYLDGPFDQLPDNFLKGDELKKAILAASPEYKGQIDRFGNFPGGEERYLISPYRHYYDEDDLAEIAGCTKQEKPKLVLACFAAEAEEGPEDDGQPR